MNIRLRYIAFLSFVCIILSSLSLCIQAVNLPDDGSTHMHEYTAKTVAPTNTSIGYTEYTCSICGAAYRDDLLPALAGVTAGTQVIQNPFGDVEEGKWYTSGVFFCYKFGYMSGTGDAVFSPNGNFTRAMFVRVLYNLSGSKETFSRTSFSDVKTGTWYSNAVEWAKTYGYTSGVDSTHFAPNGNVTREQIAQFLFNYARITEFDVDGRADLTKFDDYDSISGWAMNALSWANYNGLINGTTATTIAPGALATRSQVATIIRSFVQRFGPFWDFGETVKERSCTENGEYVYREINGIRELKVSLKGWHVPDGGKVTKAATCAAEGTKVYSCRICGQTIKTESLAKLTTHHYNSEGKCTVTGCRNKRLIGTWYSETYMSIEDKSFIQTTSKDNLIFVIEANGKLILKSYTANINITCSYSYLRSSGNETYYAVYGPYGEYLGHISYLNGPNNWAVYSYLNEGDHPIHPKTFSVVMG